MTVQLSSRVEEKLKALQGKLGAGDLETALDKSLNIANFVAETVKDPKRKLLIESNGLVSEVQGIA